VSRVPRVLLVDHAGVMGGAEHSILDAVTGLTPPPHAVLLADGPFHGALERRGIPVTIEPMRALARVKKAGAPSPAAAWDALRLARRVAHHARGHDVIVANSQKAFLVAALAGLFTRRPVVWYLRDLLGPPHFTRRNGRVMAALANALARRVITNSHATADAFVASGGRAGLARVVYNGIDAAPYDAVTEADAAACRTALDVPAASALVVHVGRFHPWKGQQVLLRAAARELRVVVAFVGAPLFGEEAFATELREEAATLGVAGRVRFLGLRDDVPRLMRAADVVVHSSAYPEPFGRVVVEGMLAGRPVVASDAGGVREILRDGVTGWLVQPDDPAALAAAIARVLDDPVTAGVVATAGAADARARFGVEAMRRGVRDALDGL
jgi:glycosyltransferase involved in cell wall biosynthesis